MSEIFKAKNRIMNRSKIGVSQQQPSQTNYANNSPSPSPSPYNEQTFDIQPITTSYPKKFNISSISMKFTKNQQDQQQSNIYAPQFQFRQSTRLQHPEKYVDVAKREKSPEFSRTERINPIRHFEPHNLNTLSQSNLHSSVYNNKWSKVKSRRLESTYSHQFQYDGKRSNVKTVIQKKHDDHGVLVESPISKIRKTVHAGEHCLLIAKQQKRRAQSPFKPRQCLKQHTQTRITQIQQTQSQLIDDQFPPSPTIVFPRKSLYSQQPDLSFTPLSKHYFNTMNLQPVILQTCEPTLITPGILTNPYVYSAVRILAEYPQRVLALVENQVVSQQGVYYVRLCKDGTWRYVVVDQFVPVVGDKDKEKEKQMLCMSSADVNGCVEIWPTIVQKALAKIYSTYHDLWLSRRDGICPLFRLLTGFPVSKYDLIKDVRSYLVLIDSALKRQHIIILQQILPQFEYLAQSKGLSLQQSYQLIQIDKNSFVLRNLTDFDLVTRLTFDEVMMFSSLLIFRKQEGYCYVSQKLRHKKGYYSVMKVVVSATTQCYWDVWQNNPAYYKSHLENKLSYEVAPYKIILQPLTQPVNNYDSLQQPQTIVQSGKQVTMKKGEYVVSVHLCQMMQEMDFTVSYYGEKDVVIERMRNGEKWGEGCCGGEWEGKGREGKGRGGNE